MTGPISRASSSSSHTSSWVNLKNHPIIDNVRRENFRYFETLLRDKALKKTLLAEFYINDKFLIQIFEENDGIFLNWLLIHSTIFGEIFDDLKKNHSSTLRIIFKAIEIRSQLTDNPNFISQLNDYNQWDMFHKIKNYDENLLKSLIKGNGSTKKSCITNTLSVENFERTRDIYNADPEYFISSFEQSKTPLYGSRPSLNTLTFLESLLKEHFVQFIHSDDAISIFLKAFEYSNEKVITYFFEKYTLDELKKYLSNKKAHPYLLANNNGKKNLALINKYSPELLDYILIFEDEQRNIFFTACINQRSKELLTFLIDLKKPIIRKLCQDKVSLRKENLHYPVSAALQNAETFPAEILIAHFKEIVEEEFKNHADFYLKRICKKQNYSLFELLASNFKSVFEQAHQSLIRDRYYCFIGYPIKLVDQYLSCMNKYVSRETFEEFFFEIFEPRWYKEYKRSYKNNAELLFSEFIKKMKQRDKYEKAWIRGNILELENLFKKNKNKFIRSFSERLETGTPLHKITKDNSGALITLAEKLLDKDLFKTVLESKPNNGKYILFKIGRDSQTAFIKILKTVSKQNFIEQFKEFSLKDFLHLCTMGDYDIFKIIHTTIPELYDLICKMQSSKGDPILKVISVNKSSDYYLNSLIKYKRDFVKENCTKVFQGDSPLTSVFHSPAGSTSLFIYYNEFPDKFIKTINGDPDAYLCQLVKYHPMYLINTVIAKDPSLFEKISKPFTFLYTFAVNKKLESLLFLKEHLNESCYNKYLFFKDGAKDSFYEYLNKRLNHLKITKDLIKGTTNPYTTQPTLHVEPSIDTTEPGEIEQNDLMEIEEATPPVSHQSLPPTLSQTEDIVPMELTEEAGQVSSNSLNLHASVQPTKPNRVSNPRPILTDLQKKYRRMADNLFKVLTEPNHARIYMKMIKQEKGCIRFNLSHLMSENDEILNNFISALCPREYLEKYENLLTDFTVAAIKFLKISYNIGLERDRDKIKSFFPISISNQMMRAIEENRYESSHAEIDLTDNSPLSFVAELVYFFKLREFRIRSRDPEYYSSLRNLTREVPFFAVIDNESQMKTFPLYGHFNEQGTLVRIAKDFRGKAFRYLQSLQIGGVINPASSERTGVIISVEQWIALARLYAAQKENEHFTILSHSLTIRLDEKKRKSQLANDTQQPPIKKSRKEGPESIINPELPSNTALNRTSNAVQEELADIPEEPLQTIPLSIWRRFAIESANRIMKGLRQQALDYLVSREPLTHPIVDKLKQIMPINHINQSFHLDLLPYQKEDVLWHLELHRLGLSGILASQMGLGKTRTSIAAMFKFFDNPEACLNALIIVPNTLIGQWKIDLFKYLLKAKINYLKYCIFNFHPNQMKALSDIVILFYREYETYIKKTNSVKEIKICEKIFQLFETSLACRKDLIELILKKLNSRNSVSFNELMSKLLKKEVDENYIFNEEEINLDHWLLKNNIFEAIYCSQKTRKKHNRHFYSNIKKELEKSSLHIVLTTASYLQTITPLNSHTNSPDLRKAAGDQFVALAKAAQWGTITVDEAHLFQDNNEKNKKAHAFLANFIAFLQNFNPLTIFATGTLRPNEDHNTSCLVHMLNSSEIDPNHLRTIANEEAKIQTDIAKLLKAYLKSDAAIATESMIELYKTFIHFISHHEGLKKIINSLVRIHKRDDLDILQQWGNNFPNPHVKEVFYKLFEKQLECIKKINPNNNLSLIHEKKFSKVLYHHTLINPGISEDEAEANYGDYIQFCDVGSQVEEDVALKNELQESFASTIDKMINESGLLSQLFIPQSGEVLSHFEKTLNDREPIVIFVNEIEFGNLLEMIIKHKFSNKNLEIKFLHSKKTDKAEIIQWFKSKENNGKIKIFISCLMGVYGLNLKIAKYLYNLINPIWNNSFWEQLMSRIIRGGMRGDVYIYRFIADHPQSHHILLTAKYKELAGELLFDKTERNTRESIIALINKHKVVCIAELNKNPDQIRKNADDQKKAVEFVKEIYSRLVRMAELDGELLATFKAANPLLSEPIKNVTFEDILQRQLAVYKKNQDENGNIAEYIVMPILHHRSYSRAVNFAIVYFKETKKLRELLDRVRNCLSEIERTEEAKKLIKPLETVVKRIKGIDSFSQAFRLNPEYDKAFLTNAIGPLRSTDFYKEYQAWQTLPENWKDDNEALRYCFHNNYVIETNVYDGTTNYIKYESKKPDITTDFPIRLLKSEDPNKFLHYDLLIDTSVHETNLEMIEQALELIESVERT